jgi:hypothetical protein
LAGAGRVTATRLGAAGVHKVRDLLLRLPAENDNLRRAAPIGQLAAFADGAVVLVREHRPLGCAVAGRAGTLLGAQAG